MKKNSKKKDSKGLIGTAMSKTKTFLVNTNEKALARTEEVVSTSLEMTAQWQHVAEKAIKGGLKLAANQQDLVFDILNEVKDYAKEGKNRFNKLVA